MRIRTRSTLRSGRSGSFLKSVAVVLGAASQKSKSKQLKLPLALVPFPRFLEQFESVRILFEELGQIRQHLDGGGAEMVFDAFDIGFLRFDVQPEQGKKAREGFVPFLNICRNSPPFFGENQAAILLVIQVPEFSQFLDHACDGGLLDAQGTGDIHDAGIALFLDQLVNPFQIIFSALAGCRCHMGDEENKSQGHTLKQVRSIADSQ